MNDALIDEANAYLDGELSPPQTRAFEAKLVQEEYAEAFRQAILMRELFVSKQAPIPHGLANRISKQIQKEMNKQERKKSPARQLLGTLGIGAKLAFQSATFNFKGIVETLNDE